MTCKEFSKKYCMYFVIAFGVMTIVFGIIFMLYFPSIFDRIFFKVSLCDMRNKNKMIRNFSIVIRNV